jgi:hypothetical protein
MVTVRGEEYPSPALVSVIAETDPVVVKLDEAVASEPVVLVKLMLGADV